MTDIQVYTIDEPYVKLDCGLGEAPYWEQSTNTLRFVDIIKQRVHVVQLDQGPSSHKILAELDVSIGTTADVKGNDEHFVFGGKHGYGFFHRKTGAYKYIHKYWTDDEVASGKEKLYRGNDGAVDSEGRFWVGTMNDPLVKAPTPTGTLFRFDPDGTLHRILEGVHIPNGISWTKDNRTMYFADSPTKTVWAYDFDATTGNISNKRPFFTVQDENGVPDGHALDEDGYMWCAVHGIGKVLRISPQGKLVAEIRVPTRCPTCPAFAGEDLYITSAADEEPEKFPESTKLHGSLFKIHVGVKGVRPNRFKWAGEVSV
ncbi:hypothetical protein IWX90DRAFT_156539 [Phyllosticta citrichinensis]|uniref:SMP-30/Gluconolactonase/LRE-like region domain-containing protein n=1 Tax=Phyllosticta citrichinensis TaxID=1130410 RepID=A0ABR1XZW5_9PEZI